MTASYDAIMDRAAERLVGGLVENAARRYERSPGLLNLICGENGASLGLADASPECIIATCEALFERTTMARFGDEAMPVNLKGAIRYARRQMEREAA